MTTEPNTRWFWKFEKDKNWWQDHPWSHDQKIKLRALSASIKEEGGDFFRAFNVESGPPQMAHVWLALLAEFWGIGAVAPPNYMGNIKSYRWLRWVPNFPSFPPDQPHLNLWKYLWKYPGMEPEGKYHISNGDVNCLQDGWLDPIKCLSCT